VGHATSKPQSFWPSKRGVLTKHVMKFLDVPQSGSIAGNTHSHNRAGQYKRNRRSPVQPVGTGRRAFIRAAFGAASTAWSGLTSAQQAAWTTYADSHPITDSLGQSIKLTGHQMYVAINTQLHNVGSASSSVPPVSAVVVAPVVTVFTAVASTGVVTLTMTASGGATDFILVAYARPQSSGRNQVSAFWQASVLAGNSTGNATTGALILAQFGALVAGQRLFLKLTPVNQYGVTGTPVIKIATVS
jgi:hypothetical protein